MSPLLLFLASALPLQTAIDEYVQEPDPAYRWEVVEIERAADHTSVVIDMVSQRWLSEREVDRPEWQHYLTLAVPRELTSDVALLYIGGGRNGRAPPDGASQRMVDIARATGTVAAELGMVPNQPLVFHGDGQPRVEDDLIGYTWDQYLESGNALWLARNAMVKSAVRAMDTISAAMASSRLGNETVNRFVVAGGSKRGWTTWLTGAMDDRVVGIVPIVIDVLNVDASMRHHFAAYGFWAVSVGNYVDHRIMRRMEHERLAEAYRLVDPYHYRHRLTMPKLVINAAGDQFFLPDSSRFYWDELRGESYLRYVPNADHGLQGTDALESLIAFHTLVKDGRKPPQISWSRAPDGTLQVMTTDAPRQVLLWQMSNPTARDFRVETRGRGYASSVVAPGADGIYRARVAPPEKGWTAYFLELEFDVGAAAPLKLTTDVTITPDVLPFAGKPLNLETSITVICEAGDEGHAASIAQDAERALTGALFMKNGLETRVIANRLYLNWEPGGSLYQGAGELREFLARRECEQISYQLESGHDMTLPPVGD